MPKKGSQAKGATRRSLKSALRNSWSHQVIFMMQAENQTHSGHFSKLPREGLNLCLQRNKVPKKQCGAALECMDVGQLTLVGIVMMGQKASIAVAQDSAGFGYMLRVGDRIGLHGGRVTKILPDRVIVTEKVEDIQGSLVPRKRVLLLHPEE